MATHEGPPQSALDLAEKNFRPAAVEADLYEWWERSGFFTPDENAKKPFVMLSPLPNHPGDLHLGPALGFAGYEDLMARYHRMRGEPTLYMPGTDHAGIIAQVVVENELAKEGITRQQLGREKFLAQMWKWMDHYHIWARNRSEEHTSELQSHSDLVCRLLLEKKKQEQLKIL